jgi:hypothetical protein
MPLVSTEDLNQFYDDQAEGLGFIPLLIAAIPAIATAGVQIAGGIMSGQQQKKLEKKERQLQEIVAKQEAEKAPLLAEQARLAAAERANLIKTIAMAGGVAAASFFAYKIASKIMEKK